MPGINELDHLSKNYGLAVALLVCGYPFLAYVVVKLYRELQQVQMRLFTILEERNKLLDSYLESPSARDRH